MGKSIRHCVGPVFWLRLQNDIVDMHKAGLATSTIQEEIRHKYFELFGELGISLTRSTVRSVTAQFTLDETMYSAELRATVAKHIEIPERIDPGGEVKASISTAAAIRDWAFEQIDKAPSDALAGNYAKLSLDAARAVVVFASEAPMSVDEINDESNETARLHGIMSLALEGKKAD